MADKLENLVARLEKATGRLEALKPEKLENLIDRLEKAVGKVDPSGASDVAKVQSTTQPSNTSTQAQPQVQPQSQAQAPSEPAFNAFDTVYNELEEKAKASENQDLISLTNIALQVFRYTDSIISLSTTSKKPSNEIIGSLQKFVTGKAKEVDQNYIHPRKVENHAKAVKEAIGAVLWIYTDGPFSYIDGVLEPTTYNANKVKMQKKVAAEGEWADKLTNVLKAYKAYVKENYSTGLIWKGKQEGDFSQLVEGKIPTAQTAQTSASSQPTSTSSTTQAQGQSQADKPAAFNAFDSVYNDFEEKAKATGNQDLINLVTNIALHVFRWNDAIIALSTTSKKPSNEIIGKLQAHVRDQGKLIEQNYIHPRKLENHAKTLKEGLGAVFWIYTDGPASYIDGVVEPAMYNANKVKMQKVAGEPEWIDKYLAILRKYKEYAKENYSTGLIWKGKQDGDFSQLVEGKVPASESTASSANASQSASSSKPDLPNRAALFSELNKGSSVTEGLKVAERKPKGQISKEPPLQPLTKTSASTQQTAGKPAESKPVKTPQKYFKDSWFIEHYTDDKNIVLEEADMREGVYIDNCHKSVVIVKGKVKSIMISNCSNFGLVFDSVISTVESVNTKGLTIQVKISAPSILLDKCERVKVYLAKDLNTDVVSSKVTELNISYLQDDDDYAKEFPVTEQIVTRWNPELKKFVTKPLDIFM